MKKNLRTISIVLLSSVISLTAHAGDEKTTNQAGCSTDAVMQEYFMNNPEAKKEHDDFEITTQNYVKNLQESRKKGELEKYKKPGAAKYIIPVVFHVLHQNGVEQIGVAQCQSALDKANEDMNGLNNDFNQQDPLFDPIKDVVDIQFCLATKDPQGAVTQGVTWHNNGACGRTESQLTQYAWDNYMYMNIYVVRDVECNGSTTNSGYAHYPNTSMSNANTARIVYNHRYLGSVGTGAGGHNSSEFQSVFTHEVGHWLNLAHIFQGGCNDGDNVADTPATNGSQGCGNNVQDCGHAVNVHNYMDYNAQCQRMFTRGQCDRMRAALDNHGARNTLWTASNLSATGCSVDGPPTADFTADKTSVCIGENVNFSDASTGGAPTSWSWTFTGGSPATSTSQNPTVSYNAPGSYSVTLTVSNSFGSNPKTITNYISVGNAGTLPYVEGFENGFLPTGWSANNPDAGLQWAHRTDAGRNSSSSMGMNNADNSVVGEIDEAILGPLSFSGSSSTQMTFDVAYTGFDANSADQLRVFASKDCGNTWTEVWMKTHSDLKTYPADGSYLTDAAEKNSWAPSTNAHWRGESVDLSAYDGESYVQLKFQNTSGYGTWIYVDNINIQQSLGIKENSDIAFNVFPNPSKDGNYSLIMYANTKDKYAVEVRNILGQVIYNENLTFKGEMRKELDFSGQVSGAYILTIKSSKEQFVKKLLKQ